MSLPPGVVHKTASELAELYAEHIKDKVVLVTGTSPNSIGSAFVHAIVCSQPGHLIIAGRDSYKIKETTDSLTLKCASTRIRTLNIDLSSFASVHRAAKEVNGWSDIPHIDILVNNAGLMATAWETSPDGYEIDLATNHLGPFLFTNLIMNKIIASPAPRVITVSSSLHRLGPFRFDDYNFHEGQSYNMWQAYGQSKTANSLMAISLAELLGAKHNLTSLSLHPGVVNSNMVAQVPLSAIQSMNELDKLMGNREGWETSWTAITADEAAATYLHAAFDPQTPDHNGAYLENCSPAHPLTNTLKSWATSVVEAEMLWNLSEHLVGQKFVY